MRSNTTVCVLCCFFSSYVIEDGSPYMRSGKQNQSTTGARSRGDLSCVVDDLSEDVWNFMSFCNKDFVKDSVPDQQLSLQDLTIRYKGEMKIYLGFNQISCQCQSGHTSKILRC